MPWSTWTTKSPGLSSAKSPKKPEVRILRLGRSTVGVTSKRSAWPKSVRRVVGKRKPSAKGARISNLAAELGAPSAGEAAGGPFHFTGGVGNFEIREEVWKQSAL